MKAFDPKLLLPALRMMVRFPTRPTKVISFETGIELTELESYIKANGRPTAARVAEIEKGYAEGGASESADAEILAEAPPVKLSAAPKRVPPPPPVQPPPPLEKPEAASAQSTSDHSETFLRIARMLLADPALLQSAACRRVGINQGTWSYFKTRQFGKGDIARDKLQAFVDGVGNVNPAPDSKRIAVAPQPETGDRRPETGDRRPETGDRRPETVGAIGRAVASQRGAGSGAQAVAKGACVVSGGELFRVEIIVRLVPAEDKP